MNREQLEALESEINAELNLQATPAADPITDGVVDINRYLAARPKMLWILKEPYDDFVDGAPVGGGWSVTKDLLAKGKVGNRGTYAPMAYITYSVFNGFPKYNQISYVTHDPRVADAMKDIAYINVKKLPGHQTSRGTDFASIYRQNQPILCKQIQGINPDIIIGGRVLPLFMKDLGLCQADFTTSGSAGYCVRDQRLYISAYHPAQWSAVAKADYVDDIVSIIKAHSPVLPLTEPAVVNRQS
jgi:hypothetical protein